MGREGRDRYLAIAAARTPIAVPGDCLRKTLRYPLVYSVNKLVCERIEGVAVGMELGVLVSDPDGFRAHPWVHHRGVVPAYPIREQRPVIGDCIQILQEAFTDNAAMQG